jgi:hypothetical protein
MNLHSKFKALKDSKDLGLNSLTLTLSMNPRFEFKALKGWKHLGLTSLTLTLTPALSPGERGNSFPRIGDMVALDLTRFKGPMREMVRENLS